MFEKTQSTSVKDMLINMIASKGEYSRDVIEKVINFQGEDMLKATRTSNQIEISGLGLLYVAKGKVSKRVARYEKTPNRSLEFEEVLNFLKEKQCQK